MRMEKGSARAPGKINHYLRRENKTNEKSGINILRDIKIFVNVYV